MVHTHIISCDFISIHAPHEGERPPYPIVSGMRTIFQSTLPTRGSDGERRKSLPCPCYFNPRSPRGGATIRRTGRYPILGISIHAPHEGERPLMFLGLSPDSHISIHAPHEGERLPTLTANPTQAGAFQSTLPTRGSDDGIALIVIGIKISIHAPHEGERHYGQYATAATQQFQSTLPTRGSDARPRRSLPP